MGWLICHVNLLSKVMLSSGTHTIDVGYICSYVKEIASYERERSLQATKIESMTEECPHVRAKQVEVQGENEKMILECREKYTAALNDLREFMSRHTETEFESGLYNDAKTLIV